MDLNTFKEWLVPGSTAIGTLSAVIAAFLALRDYKLKLQAEARLAEASKVEADVKLVKLFVELMELAHARGPSVLMTEKLFEAAWPALEKAGHADPREAIVITMPVGTASQDAAIAAIASLGRKHALLRSVAEQALESLTSVKPTVAKPKLKELRGES